MSSPLIEDQALEEDETQATAQGPKIHNFLQEDIFFHCGPLGIPTFVGLHFHSFVFNSPNLNHLQLNPILQNLFLIYIFLNLCGRICENF